MSDTLVTIIGIFLAAVLMFVFPLMTVSNTQDNIAQVSVQSLVAEFVNNVATKGKITQDDYNTFISKLYATGNTYDVQLEHKKMSTNPNKGADDQLGENLYYSVYNSVIIDSTETGINYNKEYIMKKGDYIIVTVKNTNTTIGSQIKNFMYSIIEKDMHKIAANASALVVSTGSSEVDSDVSDDVDTGNSEEDSDVIDNLNTVIFDPNEGMCILLSKQVIQGDIYGTLPTPTREGFTFAGWYTEKIGGNNVTAATIVPDIGNHILYAHWNIVIPNPDILFTTGKYFNGNEGYMISDTGARGGITANGKTSMIINATFKFDNPTSDDVREQTIVSTAQSSGYSFVIQKINGEDRILLGIWNETDGEYNILCASKKLEPGKIYNTTAIYKDQKITLYVYDNNGLVSGPEVSEQYEGLRLNQRSDIPALIGANPHPTKTYDSRCFLKGNIYNVKIWFDKDLTNEHITRIIQEATEGIF